MKGTALYKILFLVIAVSLTSCDAMSYKNKPQDATDLNINEWNESYHPNLKPMYGNKIKSAQEKIADKKYVDFMLNYHNGDTIKAAKEAARDGWHYFYQQVIDTSMFRFNQSWLIDSTYPASYFGFAAIKEYQRLNKESEEYFNIAYKYDPSDSLTKKYLHQIAQIREEHKDTLELINSYYRVISKFPKDAVATGKLGFFYSCLNYPDSALKYYNLTIEFDPEYFQTYLNRGWYYRQEGKIEEAINEFSTAIEKNNTSPNAYANRYSILMSVQRYNEAIPDITKCIELVPQESVFHKDLAECYFQLNQKDKGCLELNNGIRKGGQFIHIKTQKKCK